ncbi:MAG: alpha-L-fucosidase [Pirellulales bacterium]|nr:alpha-L-fucosidase [Pirellulales bacterium]
MLMSLSKVLIICGCMLLLPAVPSTFAEQSSVPAMTAKQREARMQWWRDAKFGLFIHWGPSSIIGKEISWSRIGHPHDFNGHESVPPEVYDNLYKKFNPVKFDANEWMRMAKDAGMKYVVFTSKHHDGFSMWPTKLRPGYSISATPFNRDICKDIADAAHKHGLKLGWYYSTRDWTHPDYLKGDNTKYNDFYHGQVCELLINYGRVDVLWFDHVAGNWGDYRFAELFDMIYRLQPNILINNRAAAFFRPTKDHPTPEIAKLVRGDFDTPEQKIGKFQTGRAWESCVTMTHCKDGGEWGGSTHRGDKIWLHIVKWPADTLRLGPLKETIKSSRTLTGGQAKVVQSEKGLAISMPKDQRDPVDTIIELKLTIP